MLSAYYLLGWASPEVSKTYSQSRVFSKIEKNYSPTSLSQLLVFPHLNNPIVQKYRRAYPTANLEVEGCEKNKELDRVLNTNVHERKKV